MSVPPTFTGRRSSVRPRAEHRSIAHRPVVHHPRTVVDPPAPAGTAPTPRRRLGRRPVLDGLRGVAVLLVILEHTGIVPNGFMGVDVFFVLSGFLITTLLMQEWERAGRVSLRRFYARRARRLLPALAALGLLALAVQSFDFTLTGWSLEAKLATTFGFVNNWVAGLSLDHGQALGALNPTWSLAQEDQFYLLWPVALILLLRRRVRPGRIVLLLAGAIAALLVLEPVLAGRLSGYSDYYSPVDRAAELLLGCAASLIWRHRMIWLPRSGVALGWPVRLGVELLLFLLTGTFVWLLLQVHPLSPRWVFLAAAAITVPALLLLIQVPRTLVGRALMLAPLRAVGRISYGLYLIHLLLRNAIQHALPGASAPQVLALTLAVSLPAAALLYRLIERPVLEGRWPLGLAGVRGRWLSRRAGAATAQRARLPQPMRSPIRSSA